MRKLFLVLLAALTINWFYPELFAPIKTFMGNAGNALTSLTADPAVSTSASSPTHRAQQPKWVAVPATFSYTDVDGQIHSLARDRKPMVLGFWTEACGFSQRMMSVLNSVRRQYPANQLDVVGIYPNVIGDSQLKDLALKEGYFVTLVAAQPEVEHKALSAEIEADIAEARRLAAAEDAARDDPALARRLSDQVEAKLAEARLKSERRGSFIMTLQDGFGPHGVAREIYIVDRAGLIHTIATIDKNGEKKSQEEIMSDVQAVLRTIFSSI